MRLQGLTAYREGGKTATEGLNMQICGNKVFYDVPEIHQARFLATETTKLPRRLKFFATSQFSKTEAKHGRAAANGELKKYVQDLEESNFAETNEESLASVASGIVIECMRAEIRAGGARLQEVGANVESLRNDDGAMECIRVGAEIAKEFGIQTAGLIKYGVAGVVARFQSAGWWMANIRRAEKRQAEFLAIKAGRVCKTAQIYVTDGAVEERREQVKQSREYMERMELEDEDGSTVGMCAAADSGISNPKNRLAELMERTNGFETVAKARKHVGIFVTLTTPSRMHGRSTTGSAHDKNTTPRMAQAYMAEVWSRCRAALDYAGVVRYGFRVLEPHHDATPHWHMMVFMPRSHAKTFREIVARYFRAEDAHEMTSYKAKKARCDFKTIDPTKGSAAAYMFKYISKNISGKNGADESIGADFEGGGDCAETSERVLTWSSLWGFRQFQQIGGHFVSTWREARRIKELDADGLPASVVSAWQAAQHDKAAGKYADWAAFVEALGGIETKPLDALVRVEAELEAFEGIYGMAKRRKVLGLRHVEGVLPSCRKVWTVRAKKTAIH